MDIDENIRKIKIREKSEEVAFFLDRRDILRVVSVRGIKTGKIVLDCFTLSGDQTGFLYVSAEKGKKAHLNAIYTMQRFRGTGIASGLHSLAEYYLRTFQTETIYGFFEPQQRAFDSSNQEKWTYSELKKRAEIFYVGKGYRLIDINKICNFPELFSEFKDFDMEYYKKLGIEKVVIKDLKNAKKDYFYVKQDGMIFRPNALTMYEKMKKEK